MSVKLFVINAYQAADVYICVMALNCCCAFRFRMCSFHMLSVDIPVIKGKSSRQAIVM